MEGAARSALVILVPEAETWVEPWRRRYDPSAAQGMPAHITLLYPFLPAAELGSTVEATLRDLFQDCGTFDFSLTDLRRFPRVLYLAPQPAAPFCRLTEAIWKRFPEAPPYEGRHSDIIPHLSLAVLEDREALLAVENESRATLSKVLPIMARAERVALMIKQQDRWSCAMTFSLGPSGSLGPSEG